MRPDSASSDMDEDHGHFDVDALQQQQHVPQPTLKRAAESGPTAQLLRDAAGIQDK